MSIQYNELLDQVEAINQANGVRFSLTTRTMGVTNLQVYDLITDKGELIIGNVVYCDMKQILKGFKIGLDYMRLQEILKRVSPILDDRLFKAPPLMLVDIDHILTREPVESDRSLYDKVMEIISDTIPDPCTIWDGPEAPNFGAITNKQLLSDIDSTQPEDEE